MKHTVGLRHGEIIVKRTLHEEHGSECATTIRLNPFIITRVSVEAIEKPLSDFVDDHVIEYLDLLLKEFKEMVQTQQDHNKLIRDKKETTKKEK
ncbi:MAG: hypothetical protein ACE5H1_01220 [Thermodesulfobacteriota bacterium]